MAKVTREKDMAVPASRLAEVITGFESYPDFLPEVVSVKREPGGTPNLQKVVFEIEIMKRFQYTLEFHIDGEREITWHLVDSNFFKMNQGKWLLTPLDGKRTHVTYEVEVGFRFFVPGWVTKKLTEVNLPKMLESFEGRARTTH